MTILSTSIDNRTICQDQRGEYSLTQSQAYKILYKNQKFDFEKFQFQDPESYNQSVKSLYLKWNLLKSFQNYQGSVKEWHLSNQKLWMIPEKYKNFDVVQHVIDKCDCEEQLQRVAMELLMFQERNLFGLLVYLKFLVDIMKENKIVWGVGRGSSTASYVLYLLEIHKIDSLKYDLPIEEFLK